MFYAYQIKKKISCDSGHIMAHPTDAIRNYHRPWLHIDRHGTFYQRTLLVSARPGLEQLSRLPGRSAMGAKFGEGTKGVEFGKRNEVFLRLGDTAVVAALCGNL